MGIWPAARKAGEAAGKQARLALTRRRYGVSMLTIQFIPIVQEPADLAATGLQVSGRPRVVFSFTITDGKIVEIDMVAEPERLRQFDLTI